MPLPIKEAPSPHLSPARINWHTSLYASGLPRPQRGDPMPYIIAVDLGGTNCRFAGFTLDKGNLSLHRMDKRKTAELPDTGALISACGTALDRHPRTADAFVVGMAAPSPIR